MPSLDQKFSSSRLRRVFHVFGLDSLYVHIHELRGHTALEQKKIVLVYDLRSACYASLLHLLPVTASILLTVFNWNGYYIGGELSGPTGEDSLKFLGLQFAAKVLELMSMASLSCILFYLVRRQLLEDVLPLGAVTSGFEFSRISLLWSKEFIATYSAKFGTAQTKAFLVATIIVFTLLGASIGPSAAVASQPTLRDWPAGGTAFYVKAAYEQLFPVVLDEVPSSELTCTGNGDGTQCFPSNYNLLTSEILTHWPPSSDAVTLSLAPEVPENALLAGRNSLRRLSNRLKGGFFYNPKLTVATTPMAFAGDILAALAKSWFIANQSLCVRGKTPSFCYYRDITNSIEIPQPIAYTLCRGNAINSPLAFPRLDQGSQYPLVNLENSSYGSQEWFDSVTLNNSIPSLTWISLPLSEFGSTSLGAIVALPGRYDPSHVFSCTIDARWINATTTATFLGGPMFVTSDFKDWDGRSQLDSRGQFLWPQVNITAQWAKHLNPPIDSNGTLAFEFLSRGVGRLNNIAAAPNSLNAIEAILTLMVTEGISRIGNSAFIQGSLKGFRTNDWWTEMLPGGRAFGTAGSAFDYIPIPGDNFAKFTMQATVNGYGYGPTTATILSITALMIYSAIAIAYMVYSTCFTRTTSSAWESISELLALAMNSSPSPALQNTGAGISTLSTLKEPVWVGSRGGKPEMCVGDKSHLQDQLGLNSIMANEFYS